MSFQSLFFSMEGRIGRGTYWIGLIGITVVSFVAGLILWRIFGERLILSGGGRFAQFVVVMALFLWMTDKTLEWVLYDLILGWKR